MSVTPATATRSELLALRRRAAFAEQGRDLLRDKRMALVREFRGVQAELLALGEELRRQASAARRALEQGVADQGPWHVESASLDTASGIEVTLSSRAVAGVVVVDLTHGPVGRDVEDRGYALPTTSAAVDAIAAAHERELELLLDLCAVELNVRRLAVEIDRTTRQVNALDSVVVPQLRAQARAVALVLDEREREEHSRLKRARDRRRTTPDRSTDRGAEEPS
jgi:V/A-type H+-transporting ATPase subunit D